VTAIRSKKAGAFFGVTALVFTALCGYGCDRNPKASPGGLDAATVPTEAAAELEQPTLLPKTPPVPGETVHEGSAVAMSRDGERLYIADEDHSTLRIVTLDGASFGRLPSSADHDAVALPGRPANIVVTATELLVTIRDPGLLMVFRRAGAEADAGAGLIETARVALPADAWGLAVSPDERTAVVTSAWTHRVSVVDLEAKKLLSSVDVGREPRGVVVSADGNGGSTAYVSHLVSTPGDLTRVDALRDPEPRVRKVALPVARARAGSVDSALSSLSATLGYALALSKDGKRLYAPRHALGAVGDQAWFGATTIDVLLTSVDEPLAPRRVRGAIAEMKDGPSNRLLAKDAGAFPLTDPVMFVQPRSAQVVGDKLFVLSEGLHAVYRTSTTAIDPGLVAEKVVESTCRGPAGMVVTSDAKLAYVFCRAPYAVEALSLEGPPPRGSSLSRVLAKDSLSSEAAEGRAIFYDASDTEISGGLACAGCHPEGRDDGHVWHEIETRGAPFPIAVGVEPRVLAGGEYVAGIRGFPRQTPMLAGRVKAEGPYGWHAENPDLRSRIEEGIHLHRWNAARYDEGAMASASRFLAAFLRQGLVTPPRDKHALTAIEASGKKLFEADETRCATCHTPAQDFTDRAPHILLTPPAAGFDEEPGSGFKPPSLLFVQGTAPYYHDGSAATLEDLVANNQDRMGKTSHLSAEERAALVAYLRTL
jgi:mono/diheme cytochrome c family protein